MDKELFDSYAALKIREKALKDEMELLYPKLLEQVGDIEEGAIIDVDLGTFTVSRRRTWTHSPEWQRKEVELDKLAEEEKQKGIATYVAKPSLTFKKS